MIEGICLRRRHEQQEKRNCKLMTWMKERKLPKLYEVLRMKLYKEMMVSLDIYKEIGR